MRKVLVFAFVLVFSSFVLAQEEVKLPVLYWIWSEAKTVEDTVVSKIAIGTKDIEVPVYDKLGNLTGTKPGKQTIYGKKIEKIPVREICGERPQNAFKIGEVDGAPIWSMLINTNEDWNIADRLSHHSKNMGTPQDILKKAQEGDKTAQKIIRGCTYTQVKKLDGEGNIYLKRVSMQEWIDSGKPPTFDDFRPYSEWFLKSGIELDKEI